MTGEPALPAAWLLPHGTLNTRRALADIYARLLRLEAVQAAPTAIGLDAEQSGGPHSAVMLWRHGGRIQSQHVSVMHQRVVGLEEALATMRAGGNWLFVSPTVAGQVLDALEPGGNEAPQV
jgi:hypothetical protein